MRQKKYKCADCPNRHFAPLTYQDLYRHLEGKDENCCDVVGLYAIMPDNNCAFLCTDFDDKSCKYGYKTMFLHLLEYAKNGIFLMPLNARVQVTVPMYGFSLRNQYQLSRQDD